MRLLVIPVGLEYYYFLEAMNVCIHETTYNTFSRGIKVMSTKNEFRIDHRFGDGGGDCVYAKLSMGGFQ